MLHDDALSKMFGCDSPEAQHDAAGHDHLLSTDDRRRSDRLPFPAELILLWNHDASLRHRYRILDASDGGWRIRSALPMLEGTTGMVMRVLSSSIQNIAQPVMVAWCRPALDDDSHGGGGYEIGLRAF